MGQEAGIVGHSARSRHCRAWCKKQQKSQWLLDVEHATFSLHDKCYLTWILALNEWITFERLPENKPVDLTLRFQRRDINSIIHSCVCSFDHLFVHSFTSFACWCTHSFILSFVHSFVCSFIYSFICSFVRRLFISSFIYSFARSLIHHSLIHSLAHSFVRSFNRFFVLSFVRSFVAWSFLHLFIHCCMLLHQQNIHM